MTDLNKVVKVALIALTMMVGAQSACADEVTVANVVDATKAPFGFVTRSSRTDASEVYNITGGGAYTVEDIKAMIETGGISGGGSATVDGKKIIVLTSTGSDMRSTVLDAITANDIIVFDGTNGDFLINEQITLDGLSNKTIIGINGARLCTTWHLTDIIKSWLNAVDTSGGSGVSNAATSSGTGGSFYLKDVEGNDSLLITIDEEGEWLTRKTLADKGSELYQKWLADKADSIAHEREIPAIPENAYFLRTEYYKKSGIFYIQGCKNIIIRNISFQGPGSVDVGGVDLVSVINGTNHVWVDHCEFIDGQDGNFDITNESDYITTSWCHFRYTDYSYVHQNTNLVGSSDTKTTDRGKLNITFAYNEWGENCRSRMPMARFGKIHLLNNWYNCANNTENAINPRLESEFLIQGNYFSTGVLKTYKMANATGVTVGENTFEDPSTSTKPTVSGSTVTVPYESVAISSAKVPDMIDLLVGPKLDLVPTFTENPDNSDDPENPLYTLEETTTRAAKGLTFSVWATNTMTYQWYKATTADLSDAAEIDGATRNSYTFKSGEEGTTYLYCVATGLGGTKSSNTIKVVIEGTGAPIFVTPLLKSYKKYTYESPKGVPMTLTVEAGDKPSYQWYHYSTANLEAAAIDGATGKSYTYTTPTGDAADVRDFFYCVATNTVEGKEFTTVSDTACVKYVAMIKPINFVADTNVPDDTDMSGITETGVTHDTTKKVNGEDRYPLIFGSNYDKGVYVTLAPEGGFKIGDVLTIAGYINNSGAAKYSQIRVFTYDGEKDTYTTLKLTENVINSHASFAPSVEPNEESYTFTSDIESVRLGRQGDTGLNVSKIVVTRGDPEEPNQPYIKTDINETYETTERTAVDIAMVADDADSYAWYTVSSADDYETGKTVITGETSSTCSFKKDDAGTYYVYGVAISGTGEVHKMDTTRIATVTVAEGAPVTIDNIINFIADTNEPDEEDLKGITLSASGAAVASVKYKTNTTSLQVLQLTTTDCYIELSVAGGFKEGDVITIAGYYNNSNTKTTGAKLTKSDGTTVLFTTENFINGRSVDDDPTSGTYTLTEDISGTLRIYRTGATNTNISQITVTREVAAPVYVEKAIYTTNFQDWTDVSASTSTPYPTHAARTTSKEDFTFTLYNTQVDNDNAEMNVAPVPSAGALKAEKGTAETNAYITVSSLANISKIMYVHGATGGSRGWGLKVKGTQENGTVDADWVTVSSAYAYASGGKSNSGDTIRVDINRTACQLMFYNLSSGNYAFLNDLVIYGIVEQTACDEPTAVKGAWQEATEKWRYTVSTTTEEAYLHYTIDGGAEQIYEGASTTLDLDPGAKLVVWAVDPTGSVEASAEVSVTIAAMPTATKPTITIGALNMAAETYPVTMAAGAGETIHYTLDGTDPTDASTAYSSAIDVEQGTTIKAVAVKTHYANSDVASATTLAFTHPTGNEAIIKDNGASGDNVGISYQVDETYNAGTYSGNSGTGIKYVTNRAVGPTGSDKGFRIKVKDGFIIKKLVFTNFSSNYESTETFTNVYVDGSTTDIREENGVEYTDVVPPFYNATSGEKSMTWTLDNLNANDSIVFHVTPGGNQVRALVQVYYEVDDSPVSVSINGGSAITVNDTNFPSNVYDDATVYDEVPTIKLTTSKGFVYDLEYEGADGEKSVYSYTIRGTTYKVKMKVKAVAAPIIKIAEEFSLVKPDANHITSNATVNGGYKVTLTDIKDEVGVKPYIIIDSDIDSESARDYKAVAQEYDPDKEYYALKNVYAFCSYVDNAKTDSTAVRTLACPENTYSKTKPFAVFIYQQGYGDSGDGQELAENASSYDATKDQIHLGLAEQYNVIDLKFASAQSSESIVDIMPGITNAKLVVLSEMIGGSGQWIDAEGNNTGSTHLAMSFRDDLIGATNVLNMKMFFYSQSKNNTSRWAWAQPATLSNSVVSIEPTNPMYKVFENVAFSRDGSVALWSGIDEESTLNRLQLVHNYNESNESLPEFISLATATDPLDGEEYDALHFFMKNGYAYVGTGLSINDYTHYDENLKELVSTIGEMINKGESLSTTITGTPAPHIRDNGDGSATITNNNAAATTYYMASDSKAEADGWSASDIITNDKTTVDNLTDKFNYAKVHIRAVSKIGELVSIIAADSIAGTTQRYFHRINTDAEAEGADTDYPFTAVAGTITIPYNQSFRKTGYTVTSWKDKNTGTVYTPGADFTTTAESQDLYLVAVWTKNEKKITDVSTDETDAERTVTWNFLQSEGAPALALEAGSTTLGKQGFIVGQVKFHDGKFIDVPLDIDVDNTVTLPDTGAEEYSGKFNNKQNSYTDATKYITEFAQVRNGTKFTFPAVYGMTVNYKQATFEKYEQDPTTKALLPTVHEKSVTYVSQSQLTDGTLTNPGLVLADGKATNGSGTATVSEYGAANLANGGNFSYAGVDTLATLTSNESAYYITPETPNTTTFTEGALNYGTAFMHSLSVTYPKLYDFTKVVNFPANHVYILPNYEKMSEDSIMNRAAAVTYSQTYKNCNGRYADGAIVDINVVPGYGFYFEENSADVTTSGLTDGTMTVETKRAHGSFTVNGAPVLTINLRQNTVKKYSVTWTPLDKGTVRVTSGTGKDEADEYTAFPVDSVITITPTPKVGYRFVKWQNAEGTEYVSENAGDGKALFPTGVTLTNAETGVLSVTVNETNAAAKYVAVFEAGKIGTTYYEVPVAGLIQSDNSYRTFTEIWPDEIETRTAADTTALFNYYHFPKSYTTSALYIPTNYTLYKSGYTISHWAYIEDFTPETPAYDPEEVEEYMIGDYHYFGDEDDKRHIIPIFKENAENFDYRTTTADITWDFRTAYFAQHLNFTTPTEFDYATHTTINGDVVIDVPLHINGKVNNTSLDEWCHFDEGTVIKVPSGQGAKFTLAAYYKLTDTTIDGVVPREYTQGMENSVPVYYYTYTTQNPATSINIVIGSDHTYYKSIRAQLPAADRVTLTTTANNGAWGSIHMEKVNTTQDKIDNDAVESDVDYLKTPVNATDTTYTLRLGSYVKVKATRNRLYELKAFVVDGDSITIDNVGSRTGFSMEAPEGTDRDYTLTFRLYSYATTVEAVYGERESYQITFSTGGQATGEAPGVRVVERGETFSMPANNQTLYLEGYTLKYWTDESGIIAVDESGVSTGKNKYEWGKDYTPSKDLFLNPVFEINEFTLFDIEGTPTVEWPLTTGDDATYGGGPLLKYQKSSGVYVSQLKQTTGQFKDLFIDLPLLIDCTASTAKVDNSASTIRCQINTDSKISVPTNSNTKISLYAVNGELNGQTSIAGSKSYSATIETGTTRDYFATVSYTGDASTQDIVFGGDAGYFKMIRAQYGKVDNSGLPALDYVTVNNIALGAYGTSLEAYTIDNLVADKSIKIPVELNVNALTMPKVKAEADQSDAIVTVNQATTADTTATIIVKTSTGAPVGIYKIVFAPKYETMDDPVWQKVEMNNLLVWGRDVKGEKADYIKDTDTKMSVNGAVSITFNHEMMATDTINTSIGKVVASGGKTLTFRYWDLVTDRDYTFTIPSGTLTDVYGGSFDEEISFTFHTATTTQAIKKNKVNFVVTHKQTHTFNSSNPEQNYTSTAKRQVASDELIANLQADGIAYGTIDEGIALANAYTGTDRYYIFVPDGEYQLKGNAPTDAVSALTADNSGVERDFMGKKIYNGLTEITHDNISITGQSETGTKLFNKPEVEGISYTSTFYVKGASGFYVQDMTLTNKFDYRASVLGGASKAVAVVLRDRGNKTIMKNVTMDSWQDTYYSNLSNANNDSRGYYENCTIMGYVDFICGDGDHWFKNCNLMLRNGKAGNAANMLAPRTNSVQKWGYVFDNCQVTTEDDVTYTTCNNKFTLARPWGSGDYSPAASFLYTTFNVLPSADGYKNMTAGQVLRFHEYGSKDANGTLLDLSTRSLRAASPAAGSYSAVMTPAEAAEYTIHNALGGTDGYDPTLYTKQISMADANLTTLDRSLTWTAQDEALCYFIFRKNDSGEYELYAITEKDSYELDDTQIGKTFMVRAANQRGGLGEPSNDLVYNVHESYQLTLVESQKAVAGNDPKEWSWSTIYLDYNAKAPTTDDETGKNQVYVYAVVDVTSTQMALKRVDILEANQGYIVKGDVGTYTFAYTDSEGEYYDGNKRVDGSLAASLDRMSILDGTVETIDRAGMNVYTLYYKANYGLGFYNYTGTYLNAYKAYLSGSLVSEDGDADGWPFASGSNSTGFIFLDDLVPTDINKVRSTADDDSERIYTVYGQKVKRSEMIKGRVYIVNGMKIAY